jgi:phenylacetate-CoA ligase
LFEYKRDVYNSLPDYLKRIVCKIPYEFLAGKAYRSTKLDLNKIEYASHEEIVKYQENALFRILDFSTLHVPAYRQHRRFVERLSAFEALKDFPFLSKERLQSKLNDYIPKCISAIAHHKAYTGGSSGNQLVFYEEDMSYAREMAFIHHQWKRVGYKPKFKKATFRGVPLKKNNGAYWQENPIHNEMQFSPFHINSKTINKYIEQLIGYKPIYLHGYPSAIDRIAEFILRDEFNGELPPIKAALLGSESCSIQQRKRIEKAFKTKVFTWYGQSERVILAGECEKNASFHHVPNYGFLEIVNNDGNSVLEGEKGELVGTGFWNRAMPLIRYKTGDYAVKEELSGCCKRNWPRFSDVQGRWNIESIFGYNGSRISAAALNMHGDLYKNVIQSQYYQNQIGKLEIRLVVSPTFSKNDALRIEEEHKKKIWDELDISIKIVDELPLTTGGKQLRIINELNKKVAVKK